MNSPKPPLRPLSGIYEPSAIVQLPDGRFLAVEDEKEHPFTLFSIGQDGCVTSHTLTAGWLDFNEAFWKLDDLEGLTIDRSGWIYAATSQSLDGDGKRKKSREKLVRFRIDGERVVDAHSVTTLKAALSTAHPALAAAISVKDVKEEGGFNIEALELSPDGQRLWVGFRSPLLDERAILACVENPAEIFDDEAAPRMAPAIETLDLDGNGIRGMTYLPALSGYLLISGPVSRAQTPFRLWFWPGIPGTPAQAVTLPGLPGIDHAEGICPAVIAGEERIIIVSDNGNRAEKRDAHFLVLEPGQLRIAP